MFEGRSQLEVWLCLREVTAGGVVVFEGRSQLEVWLCLRGGHSWRCGYV